MVLSNILYWVSLGAVLHLAVAQKNRQNSNPTILQDTRDLPQVDGRFGFLYRTEDGIAHGAVGEPNGQIHGRFTYTDPTGLKVNFNYNAGSRTSPGYNYDNNKQQPQQPANQRPQYTQPQYTQPQPRYTQPQSQYEPQPQPRPRPRPQPAQYNYNDQPYPSIPRPNIYDLPQHRLQPGPRPSAALPQPRYTRPTSPARNDIDYGSYSY